MFGDGPDSIFKSSRLSHAVILINKYVNICKYLCNITNLFAVFWSRDFVDVIKSYRM